MDFCETIQKPKENEATFMKSMENTRTPKENEAKWNQLCGPTQKPKEYKGNAQHGIGVHSMGLVWGWV